MDILNQAGQQAAAPAPSQHPGQKQPVRRRASGRVMKIITVVMLVSATLLVGALALYLGFGGSRSEDNYIDKNKFQAVFLNGGQVYFGKVRALNSRFITLDNIYYLRVNQQVQPDQKASATAANSAQDVSLAKLGCELHGPTDVMVINREQVLFWENLKTDGQVAKAIATYVQANPQGQKCDTTAATTPTTTDATKK